MLFNLYDVALYAAPHVSTDAILQAETSFSLEFQYLRTINKSTILTAAEKMLERNLSPAERALIAGKVAQLNEAYTTVHPGDCSALTFQPGLGTTLRINHQPVITIQGKRFAQLYFKIWLGEKPLSQRMKSVLLDI